MGAFAAIMVVTLVGVALVARARRSDVEQWSRTKGTVLSATVQVGAGGSTQTEAPLVFYAYQVDGEVFRGHRVRVRRQPCNAASVIARYPAGSSVVVYYDPADPSNSALEV